MRDERLGGMKSGKLDEMTDGWEVFSNGTAV
jgi:hypothetical protein